jgi:hypothetical protein
VSATGQYVANGEQPPPGPGEKKSYTAIYAAAGIVGLLALLAVAGKRSR